ANLGYGKSILVLGGGAMGLLMTKLAMLSPIAKLAVADPHPEKRAMAMAFGAQAAFDPHAPDFFQQALAYSDDLGYDSVIEASGSRSSSRIAFHLLARGGILVYFGLYGMNYDLPLNLFNLYWKDAFVTAVYPAISMYQPALELAPRLGLEEIITSEFPFEQAPAAFAQKAVGKDAKVILRLAGG
ncbi:MAG: zinc-binding dehydrogenase, partial [Clostridia bacterium]|nr:zinc-binding dehydrogenase [Clostridia bacterium]